MLATPNPHLGGTRVYTPGDPYTGGGTNSWIGGVNLEAPVPFQILDTIDPVLHAVYGLSGLARSTQGVRNNVVSYNNYYEQKGGTSDPDLNFEGIDDLGPAPYIEGNWFSRGVHGDWIPSSAQNGTLREFQVDTSYAGLYESALYDPDGAAYAGEYAVLAGNQVNHDTMPLYCTTLVEQDFGIST